MQEKDFERLVEEGIKAIPKEFLEKLDNVEIVIENNPTTEQLKKLKIRNNTLVFGLYEGVPKTKRWGYAQVLPDKITIFKNQIEKSCSDENKIKEIVKDTVWHEIAHHFGMDEQRVRKAELRRKK
ncbi:MAG: metallopeptidase family protein [Candidatus Paceibacterota bacterium]|jgi:predicted Zn-dependent protease with MMP-like domain